MARAATWSPWETSRTRSWTRSQARSLLSIARSNRARSRARSVDSCSRPRMAHMSLRLSGAFWPTSLPLFQGSGWRSVEGRVVSTMDSFEMKGSAVCAGDSVDSWWGREDVRAFCDGVNGHLGHARPTVFCLNVPAAVQVATRPKPVPSSSHSGVRKAAAPCPDAPGCHPPSAPHGAPAGAVRHARTPRDRPAAPCQCRPRRATLLTRSITRWAQTSDSESLTLTSSWPQRP